MDRAEKLTGFKTSVMQSNVSRKDSISEQDNNVDNLDHRLKKNIERISRLRPIDDFFFQKLAEDRAVCEEILRVILEDPSLEVISVTPQNSICNLYGRSVRLDALCNTARKGVCNVEIQRADKDDHFRRVRYNASCITANIADPGTNFRKVPNVCIVYVTEFDIFNKGRTIYHACMTDLDSGTVIDDGLSCVYVNTAINDGTEISELMQCFMEENVNNSKFPNLTRKVTYFKNSGKGVHEMCSILEELKEEGRNEGRAEGRAEGIILIGKRYSLPDNEIINELLLNCEYTYEQAANILKQYNSQL